jgi:hypothetical protein
MAREGYTFRKKFHRFEKPFPYGRYEYVLGFDGRGGLVAVDAAFFVHFDALERQFKEVLGYECPWSAGATLLNAGADPWKFWLFDEGLASLSVKERGGYTSEAVHPQGRIETAAQFLAEAYRRFAVPLFQQLQTYRDLADFYAEYRRNGYTGPCRPLPENVVYLSLLVAASLGDDLREIVASAKGMESLYFGDDVDSLVRTVLEWTKAADRPKLQA